MNKKELRNLAKKIAKAERVLQDKSADEAAKQQAREEIFFWSGRVTSLDDICELDELIQDILNS